MDPMRRPMRGYQLFTKVCHERVKVEQQDLTTQELLRYVSVECSKLTLDQMNKYDIEAGDERAYQNQ